VPNAIWTGSISFGLVTVPVRMISATRSQDVRFHQLEEGTGSRLRLRRNHRNRCRRHRRHLERP
jgi:DNA end-binding protein Ku